MLGAYYSSPGSKARVILDCYIDNLLQRVWCCRFGNKTYSWKLQSIDPLGGFCADLNKKLLLQLPHKGFAEMAKIF